MNKLFTITLAFAFSILIPTSNNASAQTCEDSDGGKSYGVLGWLNKNSDFCVVQPSNTPGPSCSGENCFLLERFCNNGVMDAVEIPCSSGCDMGVCLEYNDPDPIIEEVVPVTIIPSPENIKFRAQFSESYSSARHSLLVTTDVSPYEESVGVKVVLKDENGLEITDQSGLLQKEQDEVLVNFKNIIDFGKEYTVEIIVVADKGQKLGESVEHTVIAPPNLSSCTSEIPFYCAENEFGEAITVTGECTVKLRNLPVLYEGICREEDERISRTLANQKWEGEISFVMNDEIVKESELNKPKNITTTADVSINVKARKAANYTKFDLELFTPRIFNDTAEIKNKTAVDFLQQRGILSGYPDGSFGPDKPINRAESLKVLLEALGGNIEDNGETEFSDVAADAWFAKYVRAAKAQGVVKGYEDGTFKPGQTVNQVELLKIAFEAFGIELSDYSVTNLPNGIDTNAWFATYLQYALDTEILDEESINPSEGMTRDLFSDVIYRLIQQQDSL